MSIKLVLAFIFITTSVFAKKNIERYYFYIADKFHVKSISVKNGDPFDSKAELLYEIYSNNKIIQSGELTNTPNIYNITVPVKEGYLRIVIKEKDLFKNDILLDQSIQLSEEQCAFHFTTDKKTALKLDAVLYVKTALLDNKETQEIIKGEKAKQFLWFKWGK